MIAAVTIVTYSHFADAVVLKQSLEEFNNWHFAVVVVGPGIEDLPEELRDGKVLPQEFLSEEVFKKKVAQYEWNEVCFYLKPFSLMYFLAAGFEEVHYFDSDIKIFGSLAPLSELLRNSDVLLTPHYIEKPPSDFQQPNSLTLLKAGVFNAGYVGVRKQPQALEFLKWWSGRLERYCRNDPANGMCGDQKWLDLAPILFEKVNIVRHPGANVGYWNLQERVVRSKNGTYFVNNSPLLFFHFSGFSYKSPHEISKYLKHAKINIENDIAQIVEDYGKRLIIAGKEQYEKRKSIERHWAAIFRSVKRYFRSIRFMIEEAVHPGGNDG